MKRTVNSDIPSLTGWTFTTCITTIYSASAKSAPSQRRYSYRVKLINPMHRKDVIVRDLRRFHGHFYSITDLKVRLMEELEEGVPQTTKFAVGYFVQLTKY